MKRGAMRSRNQGNGVVLTPSTPPARFFPPWLSLRRSGTSATLIKTVNVASFAACLCPARVQGVQSVLGSARCEAPAKQETHRVTQLARDYFWTAFRRFTSHNTTFTQPNSFCGFCPSQNTLVQSPNVFLAWPDSDRLSIMTFSEIGPGSLKCNAFDRCPSLQLHKSRYRVRGRRCSERAGCCGLFFFLGQSYWGISGLTSYLCHISAI